MPEYYFGKPYPDGTTNISMSIARDRDQLYESVWKEEQAKIQAAKQNKG